MMVAVTGSVFGTCLLVHGSETLLSDRAVAERIGAARAEEPQVEVIDLDGTQLDAGRFVEATGGSLFSRATAVVLRQLGDVDRQLVDLVVETAADPAEDLCLVLVHPGGVKGKGILDKLRKAKVHKVDAVAPKPWKVPDFISGEARRAGLRMDADAVAALHQSLGSDLRTLAAAVAQLAADAEGPVDAEAVHTYFGGRVEVTSYAVADAVLAGRVDEALEKLRWALSTGVAPVLVTSAMATGLRSLGRYLDARTQRMGDGQIASAIGVPPWKLKDLESQRRRWDRLAVARAMRQVATADAAVKGAAVDPDYALEAMILAIEAARSARPIH